MLTVLVAWSEGERKKEERKRNLTSAGVAYEILCSGGVPFVDVWGCFWTCFFGGDVIGIIKKGDCFFWVLGVRMFRDVFFLRNKSEAQLSHLLQMAEVNKNKTVLMLYHRNRVLFERVYGFGKSDRATIPLGQSLGSTNILEGLWRYQDEEAETDDEEE